MDQNDCQDRIALTRWRTDHVAPSDSEGEALRATAYALLDRGGKCHSVMIRAVLTAERIDTDALRDLVTLAADGPADHHDAAMSIIAVEAWQRSCLAPLMSVELRKAALAEAPGSPGWRRLVRLASAWAGRAGIRSECSPDADAPPSDAEWLIPLPVPAFERRLKRADESERIVPVLDRIAPRAADRTAEVAPYEALLDGLPLRRPAAPAALIITTLREEFPWFAPLIDAIEAEWHLGLGLGANWMQTRPILIHGPPGIGKSRFAARLAELAGTGFGFLSVSGSSDNRALLGTAMGYGTAVPSWPAQMLCTLGCANPILMIDEIDKTGEDRRNGRAADALLTMIEPVTARMWNDECLGGALDLRHVTWLLCANDLARVDPALRSRLRCVAVEGPDAADFPRLLRAIAGDIASDFGGDRQLLPVLDNIVMEALAEGFARTGSIRRLRRAYELALGQQLRRESIRPN